MGNSCLGLLYVFLVFLAGACKERDLEDTRLSDVSMGDNWDTSNIPPSAAAKVKDMLDSNTSAPGFPPAPRRSASVSDKQINASAFTVDLSFNAFGVSLGAQVQKSMGLTYTSGLVLVRQTNGVQQLLKPGGELNWDDGFPFVAMCSYSAAAETGYLLKATVKIIKVSHDSSQQKLDEIRVDQVSKVFAVERGQSVNQLLQLCHQVFHAKVKNSVIADLSSLIAARAGLDKDATLGDFEKAEKAALYGPPVKGIKFADTKWNVSKADVYRDPGNKWLVIQGYVQKWEKFAGFIPENAKDIFYQYCYDTDTGEQKCNNVGDSSATNLVNLIVAPVFSEYREKTKGSGKTQDAIDIAIYKKEHPKGGKPAPASPAKK